MKRYCSVEDEGGGCPTCTNLAARRRLLAPRILAHPIGGGWDLRHEGCAPKCCEDEAIEVTGRRVGCSYGRDPIKCSGCGEHLSDPPGPMEFDRNMACDAHFHDEYCSCNDCIRQHMAQEIL